MDPYLGGQSLKHYIEDGIGTYFWQDIDNLGKCCLGKYIGKICQIA